jgi:hypothetical protein
MPVESLAGQPHEQAAPIALPPWRRLSPAPRAVSTSLGGRHRRSDPIAEHQPETSHSRDVSQKFSGPAWCGWPLPWKPPWQPVGRPIYRVKIAREPRRPLPALACPSGGNRLVSLGRKSRLDLLPVDTLVVLGVDPDRQRVQRDRIPQARLELPQRAKLRLADLQHRGPHGLR